MASESRRENDDRVEPLFSALEEPRAASKSSSLRWKLLWAALVFAGLLALVLKQAF